MAKPKKQAGDLTTEEALRKLFPKKVVEEAKKEAEKAASKKPKLPITKEDTP